MMKALLLTVVSCAALLTGCAVGPYPYDDSAGGPGCPPGQAKKGNCRVDQYGNESFCPPGKAKKGQC